MNVFILPPASNKHKKGVKTRKLIVYRAVPGVGIQNEFEADPKKVA